MGDENTTEEYGRPRRPNPETVSYLRGLPLEEALAAEQAREYIQYFQTEKVGDNKSKEQNDDPPEYPALLSATHAALSSIHKELASLSCEENSCTQIETLVRIACRYSNVAKRVVLLGMSGYWVFLSSHRFGSHVAQTVLRCVVASCEADLDVLGCDREGGEGEGKMIIEESYGSLLQSGNGGHGVPSLSSLLVKTLEELKLFAADLAVHVCGTHVLRTALCILAGVEFVDAYAPVSGAKDTQNNAIMTEWDMGPLASTRRGKFKDKKKKKKKKSAEGDEDRGLSRQEVTVMKSLNMTSDLQSEEFRYESDSLLRDMVHIISLAEGQELQRGIKNKNTKVLPPGELQQRSCHPSAGPLLVQMLRLLSYRDNDSNSCKTRSSSGSDALADRKLGILPLEPRYSSGSEAESLVYRLLCWDPNIAVGNEEDESSEAQSNDNDMTKQPYASDIIYGLSGEPRGSILLETIFHCCPDSFHNILCKIGGFYDEATMREYVCHGVSNFVVQSLLVSSRNKNQVSKLVKCLCGIVEDGSILNAKQRILDESLNNDDGEQTSLHGKNRRMGIIWRALEMCASKGSPQDQEQIIHALMRGYASTVASTDCNDDKEGSKRKKRSKSKGMSVQDCIPLLLGLTPSKTDGTKEYSNDDRLTLDAAGARALYHVFHFTQRFRSEWVNGFVKLYDQNDMVKIANDGLASRW